MDLITIDKDGITECYYNDYVDHIKILNEHEYSKNDGAVRVIKYALTKDMEILEKLIDFRNQHYYYSKPIVNSNRLIELPYSLVHINWPSECKDGLIISLDGLNKLEYNKDLGIFFGDLCIPIEEDSKIHYISNRTFTIDEFKHGYGPKEFLLPASILLDNYPYEMKQNNCGIICQYKHNTTFKCNPYNMSILLDNNEEIITLSNDQFFTHLVPKINQKYHYFGKYFNVKLSTICTSALELLDENINIVEKNKENQNGNLDLENSKAIEGKNFRGVSHDDEFEVEGNTVTILNNNIIRIRFHDNTILKYQRDIYTIIDNKGNLVQITNNAIPSMYAQYVSFCIKIISTCNDISNSKRKTLIPSI
jgi:hypothetical protein